MNESLKRIVKEVEEEREALGYFFDHRKVPLEEYKQLSEEVNPDEASSGSYPPVKIEVTGGSTYISPFDPPSPHARLYLKYKDGFYELILGEKERDVLIKTESTKLVRILKS